MSEGIEENLPLRSEFVEVRNLMIIMCACLSFFFFSFLVFI